MSELALPEGWVKTEILNLGEIVTGKTPKKSEVENYNGDILFIKPSDLDGSAYINNTEDCISELGLSKVPKLPKNTVMVTCIGNLGKIGITTRDCATNQQINSVIPYELINYKYLYYNVLLLRQWLEEHSSATTISIINKTKFSKAPVVLAGLYEQKEIVKFLDTHLTTVSQIQTRLDAIPKLIEKFRQSVLSDAVSGRLTEEWRKDQRYQQVNSYEIPTSWTLLSIEDIADVKGGKRLPKGEKLVEFDTGYPYVRAGQLKQGTVVNTEEARSSQKYLLAETQKQIENYIVKENDAYITIVGASIGDAGLIPKSSDGANLTENAAKLTNYKKELNPVFLSFWLRSVWIQHEIKLQTKSAAQGKLALHRIKSLPFVYPTYDEQNEIVQSVEQFFDYADQIEKSVATAKARVDHLTQSILHQAFTGNLTAEWREQNPELISGDNSAEALLAKIKAEKQGVVRR